MEEFFAALGVFATPLAVAFSVAFFMTRGELKRLREERRESRSVDRMDRVEQAVDAIAIQVERLTEHQQFAARLLSGREEAGRPSQVPPGGSASPR